MGQGVTILNNRPPIVKLVPVLFILKEHLKRKANEIQFLSFRREKIKSVLKDDLTLRPKTPLMEMAAELFVKKKKTNS